MVFSLMYNKISQIVLNSGRANGVSDVFVAQPDALKESLAGKIFIIAEIEGKKTDSHKILDFLIASLEDNYYNDEKILLRDKIEGLKIENIFEAALAKTNKALADFLNQEKTQLNPAATNITLGIIYENKLHFSSYGKNRALLVFPRNNNYELVNIEANATDFQDEISGEDAAKAKMPRLFSSIISGEIPENAYFVFTNETLPEYLSDDELINIITKLPPIVASEQIKNTLAKINSYVPFLGIIVKNTLGSNIAERQEEIIDSLSAHTSISALNHTEQRTEQMLSPAGLIDLRKIVRQSSAFLGKFSPAKTSVRKQYPKKKTKKIEAPEPSISTVSLSTSAKKLNLPRRDSFLIKDKIFFKKKSSWIWMGVKKYIGNISKIIVNFFPWAKSLNKKNSLLFSVLAIVLAIFLVSLLITTVNNRRQSTQEDINNLVAKIEEKQNLMDSHLLYDDEEGAKIVLADTQALLELLPNKTKSQQELYNRLIGKLQGQEDKIQKIVKVEKTEEVANLSGLSINNLTWVNDKLYSSSNNAIYEVQPGSEASIRTEITATNLQKPYFDDKESIYYLDDNKIVQFNIKNKQGTALEINGLDGNAITNFRIFSNNLYALTADKNQIQRYNRSGNTFTAKSDWIQGDVDLSQAKDLVIDGHIYVLNNNGEVIHLYKGQKEEYGADIIMPTMISASKLFVTDEHLYILDAPTKRIALLNKADGQLLKQYQIDSLQQPRDMAIDEKNKIIYILDNETVYKIIME